jgi:hypothetical protein
MNRHERCKRAKVARIEQWPLGDPRAAMLPHGCIWHDCLAHFTGDMPDGWTWHIIYHDAHPTIAKWTAREWFERPYQDVCMCPEHSRQLDRMLKVGREISMPAARTA